MSLFSWLFGKKPVTVVEPTEFRKTVNQNQARRDAERIKTSAIHPSNKPYTRKVAQEEQRRHQETGSYLPNDYAAHSVYTNYNSYDSSPSSSCDSSSSSSSSSDSSSSSSCGGGE